LEILTKDYLATLMIASFLARSRSLRVGLKFH
jgi:hypothetical protein